MEAILKDINLIAKNAKDIISGHESSFTGTQAKEMLNTTYRLEEVLKRKFK